MDEHNRDIPGLHPDLLAHDLPVRLLFEPIGNGESWTHLRSGRIGRVSLTAGALPIIVPVNYRVVDDAIVLHADQRGTLPLSAAGAVVAFEAGDVPIGVGIGWSVLVRGIIRRLSPPGSSLGPDATDTLAFRNSSDVTENLRNARHPMDSSGSAASGQDRPLLGGGMEPRSSQGSMQSALLVLHARMVEGYRLEAR
jgi:hypothetical protein